MKCIVGVIRKLIQEYYTWLDIEWWLKMLWSDDYSRDCGCKSRGDDGGGEGGDEFGAVDCGEGSLRLPGDDGELVMMILMIVMALAIVVIVDGDDVEEVKRKHKRRRIEEG